MTKGQQRAFVLRFFGIGRRQMSRKRLRHWKRQNRRLALQTLKDLEPITTVAHDFESFCAKKPEDHEDFEENRPYCFRCSNTGSLNCYCGGDFCCCDNHGEFPCPECSD